MCSAPLLVTRCTLASYGGTHCHTCYFGQCPWMRGTPRARFVRESLCKSISSMEGLVAALCCTPPNPVVREPWADSLRSSPIFKEYSPERSIWPTTAPTTHSAATNISLSDGTVVHPAIVASLFLKPAANTEISGLTASFSSATSHERCHAPGDWEAVRR